MPQTKRCVCPHDCPDTCGMLAVLENGGITALQGDPEHPFTQGFLCAKGSAYAKRIYSPKRVLAPLLRSGPKGSGQFETIGWDQALDLVEKNLKQAGAQHGPESILPYSYAGSMGLITRNAGHAFFHKLGASRLEYTICSSTATEGFNASLGSGPSTDIERTIDSDLIIIWGSNTLATNLHARPN